jgi:hypothetical protein
MDAALGEAGFMDTAVGKRWGMEQAQTPGTPESESAI